MKLCLFNRLNCELDAWASPEELAQAILTGHLVLADDDQIRIEEEAPDPLDDFNYVGSRHHY